MAKAIKEIVVYLCPTGVQSIEDAVEESRMTIQQDVENSSTIELTVPLISATNPCLISGYSSIVAYLFPTDEVGTENRCIWGWPAIEWERGIDSVDTVQFNSETFTFETVTLFKSRDFYLTIDFENPSSKCASCHWLSSRISAQNPMSPSMRYPYIVQIQLPSLSTGSVPADPETREEYIIAGPPPLYSHKELQPNITPGELFALHWNMKIGGSSYNQLMMQAWFHTPLFTGGKVLSVYYDTPPEGEDIDETTRKYSVEIQGSTYTNIRPLDWAEHQVGEWVYVLKQNAEGNSYNRTTAYGFENEIGSGDTLRLAPITFYGGNAISFGFDDFELNMVWNFDEVFEYSYFEGVMRNYPGTNETGEVDVLLPTSLGGGVQRYTGVHIFYNCQGQTKEIGHGAFREGDAVILLCRKASGFPLAQDLTIIGFKNNLYSCELILILSEPIVGSYEESTITVTNGTPPYTYVVDPEYLGDVTLLGEEDEADAYFTGGVISATEVGLIIATDSKGVMGEVEITVQEAIYTLYLSYGLSFSHIDDNYTSLHSYGHLPGLHSKVIGTYSVPFPDAAAPYSITNTINGSGGFFDWQGDGNYDDGSLYAVWIRGFNVQGRDTFRSTDSKGNIQTYQNEDISPYSGSWFNAWVKLAEWSGDSEDWGDYDWWNGVAVGTSFNTFYYDSYWTESTRRGNCHGGISHGFIDGVVRTTELDGSLGGTVVVSGPVNAERTTKYDRNGNNPTTAIFGAVKFWFVDAYLMAGYTGALRNAMIAYKLANPWP